MPKKKAVQKTHSHRGAILCFVVGLVLGLCCGFASKYIHFGGCKFYCKNGACADANGCCPGEVYTDMMELGWNCCPPDGDCFPPMK